MLRVAFVPTAGAKEGVYWKKTQLWSLLTWPVFKFIFRFLKLNVKYRLRSELKEEAKARLEEAAILFFNGDIDLIYVAGGYDKNRADYTVPMLMRDFLEKSGVDLEVICLETGEGSVETSGNARSFVEFLIPFLQGSIDVWVCSSWYHNGRVISDIKRALKNVHDWRKIPRLHIRRVSIWPPLSWECLMREYLFNLLFEIPKRFLRLFLGSSEIARKLVRISRR